MAAPATRHERCDLNSSARGRRSLACDGDPGRFAQPRAKPVFASASDMSTTWCWWITSTTSSLRTRWAPWFRPRRA